MENMLTTKRDKNRFWGIKEVKAGQISSTNWARAGETKWLEKEDHRRQIKGEKTQSRKTNTPAARIVLFENLLTLGCLFCRLKIKSVQRRCYINRQKF
jgi:hypothetical protein